MMLLVWESKSRTTVGEYKEAESFISIGDDEWRQFAGDFLFLFEDIMSGIDFMERDNTLLEGFADVEK